MDRSIEPEHVIDAAADFARALTQLSDTGEVLYRLAEQVSELLALEGTGVSLADDAGRLHPVTGINQLTTDLEETEERLQEGPCIDTFRDGSPVTVHSAAELAVSWPRWSRAAADHGVQAAAAAPLQARDTSLGSVNLYRRAARPWHQDEVRVVGLFADMASSYIAHRAQLERSQELSAQLQQALDARVIIEQAKGVLASKLNCTVDHAFTVLRDHARRTSSSLRAVAHAVVHQGFQPPHPPSTRQG